jgi:hypothetical protein
MCTVLLPPGDNPIEINKYIISYQKVKHNEEACWIRTLYQKIPGKEWSPIPEKEVTMALKQC